MSEMRPIIPITNNPRVKAKKQEGELRGLPCLDYRHEKEDTQEKVSNGMI